MKGMLLMGVNGYEHQYSLLKLIANDHFLFRHG